MAPTTNKNRLKPIPTWYLLDKCAGAVRVAIGRLLRR